MNDKQFTDELFKRMYDMGYRKAEVKDDTLFFFADERGCLRLFLSRVPVKSTCFEEKDQLIDIAEYLGIVDWYNVKCDTPILVRDSEQSDWEKRHFAFYDNETIYAWDSGLTSWTIVNHERVVSWNYAKLAEV